MYEFETHDQHRFWDWQVRGQARYGMFDWGECAWVSKDLLERGIRTWARMRDREYVNRTISAEA